MARPVKRPGHELQIRFLERFRSAIIQKGVSMASEVQSVLNPTLSLVHGSQALTTKTVTPNGGKILPQDGKSAADTSSLRSQTAFPLHSQTGSTQQSQTASKQQSQVASTLQSQVAQLNKYLNDSGRPSQFRASADDKSVEEVNPATGEVVAEYSAAEFPALARSVGISGATINSRA
jgi:hypothetical protein